MKVKFRDANSKIRIMIVDDNSISTGLLGGQEISRSEYVKENIKEAKQEMKKAFRGEEKKHISEFVETLNENDFLNALPDYEKLKIKKEDVVFFDPALLDRFYQFMEENYVSEEDRLYYFFFTWDPKAIFRYDNRSNNPEKASSVKKFINTKSITDLASRCNLECEDVVEEDGVDVLSLVGKKEDFHKFFQEVAKLLTEAEQYGIKVFGNLKVSEIEEAKERYDNEIKKAREDIEYSKQYIAENEAILNNPSSTETKKLEAKEDIEDLKYSLEREQADLERLLKDREKSFKAIEGSEYDADYVEKNYGYNNKGFIKYSAYSPSDIFDSKSWFGIKDCKFKFNFENSTLMCDSKCYNYIKVMDALKKSYTDTKQEGSFEQWISKHPKTIKKIISGLKELTEKGDKNIMNDSLKNTKFRFSDGTVIEVIESDGKDLKAVKDEAIKVYKQFKEMKEKEPTALKDGEKETKEVLEEYDAKATNDSKTEDGLLEPTITPELSAKKAFEEGKTVKEWFAEEGYKFFNGENSLENKTEAVKLWNKVKEELESEKQLAEHEADEAEWEEAFKNADIHDSVDSGEYLGSVDEYKVYKITNYEQAHNYALPKKDGKGLAINGSEYWGSAPNEGPQYWKSQIGRTLDNAFYFYITSPLKDSWCVFFNKLNGGKPVFTKFEDDVESRTNPGLDLSVLPSAESLQDSVETSGDQYEVIVNGKLIGTFATEKEAEEAEKKALEAVEKGIPQPTEE